MFLSNLWGFGYQKFAKPIFFNLDPEDVHDNVKKIGTAIGKFAPLRTGLSKLFVYSDPILKSVVSGITFDNPVGLSEGFDKDGDLLQILPSIGFGFTQIGSITLHPYEGNPKPRLYRLPKSQGLVVNYGLKGIGTQNVIEKLKKVNNTIPISISVAKTNSAQTVSVAQGIDDYIQSLKMLQSADIGNFYTINISCPNTFGGEPFTTPDKLEQLLSQIDQLQVNKPVYIKMPVDFGWSEFSALLEVIIMHKVDGVIIANLTKDRSSVVDTLPAEIKGGISGALTRKKSDELIKKTFQLFGSKLKVIGVGGIFGVEDAWRKIVNGASLVQLITGMVYCGPQLIGQINYGLAQKLRKHGFKNIADAVGSGVI